MVLQEHKGAPQTRRDPIARLIQVLGRFPGIGEKTATRLAFYIIRQGAEFGEEIADAVRAATSEVRFCTLCMNLTQQTLCGICGDGRRDAGVVCVVENVQDLLAIERSHEFRGLYHVLHGTLAPLEGIGPDEIKIAELLKRVSAGSDAQAAQIKEVIVATNPNVEGEATALYLHKLLHVLGVRVSRIASGMPIGGDFEYADPATISRALQGRVAMS